MKIGSEYSSCYNGGSWKGAQTDDTISVTVSDYEVNLTQLPYANRGNASNGYVYYNPNEISHYWEIQNACFSAGEIWLVQPFYNHDGNYVAEEEGSGTFRTTVQDANLKVTGESGSALRDVIDNSNQMNTTDDAAVNTVYLSKPGAISSTIRYMKYGVKSFWDELHVLTEGCAANGKDWILSEGELAIAIALVQESAEGLYTGVAYDSLIKFDDAFFVPDGTYSESKGVYSTGKTRVLFGAKPNQKGWDHQGKDPAEDGYDEEMMQATADDLVFFSSLEELEDAGYICVAVLYEGRGMYSTQLTQLNFIVNGTVNPKAESGGVYMCTIDNKAWSKGDVQEIVAKSLGKDVADLTDEDYNTYVKSEAFPSRAGGEESKLTYQKDYPEAFWTKDYASTDGLKTYQKATYNENGFVSATGGYNYGDSCLVVDYATQITKSPNQPGSDEGGKKLSYDMDTSQREVDYVLYPTAVRAKGESSTEGTGTTTTVYIEDTLPKGLDYILNSAYYGGTYTSNGGGQAGLVTGGQQLYPEITENADGTTTLLFTLEDVTVTPEETTRFEPIYYSCLIGTPGVEETDVVNQQQLLNSVKIWSDDEQVRDFVTTNGNYAQQSILISKNRAVSFSKTSDQKIVELGDEMGFTIHHGNNSGNSTDVVDVDFLPHNEDGRGTQITGQVVVSELTVQSKELIKEFKLYYTTDTDKRNTKASDYQAADFTEENGWIEMEVDPNTGEVTLPDVTHVIVAVAAVGTLTPNSTLKMHITFDVPDGKPGEYLVNSFGSGEMESNARTYIVNRQLEGVVWLDGDENGLREKTETLLDGVKVTLMQKDENGDYTPYRLDGKPVAVETGKQVDVLTREVTDYTEGAYRFLHLPKGDFGVKFESGSVSLDGYIATKPNEGTDDTIDSDAIPENDPDGKLVSASIEDIPMPGAREITVQTYESRDHDLGLYASKIDIPVEKVWEDGNDQDGKRPGSVLVTLYANGEDTKKILTLTKGNSWKGTFTDLLEYENGRKIQYEVKETPVSGYDTEVTGDSTKGFTITNTHTPETVTLSGKKTWDDGEDQDGKRPQSLTIRLYANGTELTDRTQTVTADKGWSWTFPDLPKYEGGQEIVYTITEDAVPGYTTQVDGMNVTNRYTPGKTSVTVTKAWEDAGDQDGLRPEEITVKLLANGKETGKTLQLKKETQWTGTFLDLDEYANGQKIEYTVEEEAVEGYTSVVSGDAAQGFVITNTHTPETVTLSGKKTWDDGDDQDRKRPESITIRLYANGIEREDLAQTVTAREGWAWSFGELPKCADGKEIAYTITEDLVPEYQTDIDGMDVTNRYSPGKISIPVTKHWEDQDNADGSRPASIRVELYADGKETGKELVLNEKNQWSGTFSDLDEKAEGEPIAYTIREVPVEGYETVISGTMETGYVITNYHTPVLPGDPDDPAAGDDPGKPEETAGSKTGDPADVALWLGLLAISGAVLGMYARSKQGGRRKRHRR